ncbi:carbon-nitrogen hydrolase family protein [Aquisalinus flavus]|nr:carbon-nitrogen hydrolase family protein [Aquisalinus flavus]UNE49245.1 carbon-nitrogen hydrolase family protein [Aquisalinus flavus]
MRSGLSRADNTADASALIREAAGQGADLILTPEMTNVVDRKPRRLFDHLGHEDELEELSIFSALAKELEVHLIIGSCAVALDRDFSSRRAANRTYFFGPDGGTLATYDKIHMFDVDLPDGESWKESNVYRPGKAAEVVETPLGKIGLSICYDLRFPRLYRTLAQSGARLMTVPAAFTRQTGRAHWEPLLRARAIENGAFVMAAAQGGTHEDGRETWGHSMIVGPWGDIISEKSDDEPGIVIAEIDLADADKVRQRIPSLGLEQGFEINNIKGL